MSAKIIQKIGAKFNCNEKLRNLKTFHRPVFKYKFDDYQELNNQLSEYIYELRENDKEGLKESNKGGGILKFLLTDINSIQYKFGVKLQNISLMHFKNFGWKVKIKIFEFQKCGQ